MACPLPVLRNFEYCAHRQIAHKIISVTFFSGTTQASLVIFGTEHQYGELYRVTHFSGFQAGPYFPYFPYFFITALIFLILALKS